MMEHGNTVRSLRFRYILGLSAIAFLVTASFIMMQRVISQQRFHATIVNMASHQAGLSNRITYFASLMALTDDATEYTMAQGQIGMTANKMRQRHATLRNGLPEDDIPVVSNENLQTIYEDPMVGLDRALENFLQHAEVICQIDIQDFKVTSSSYIFLTTYGPNALEPMFDAAVDEYEKIGNAAILRIKRLERIIWLATLFVLLFEIACIFIPLESKVKNTLKSLEQNISELTRTRKRLLLAQEFALIGDWELDLNSKVFTWSDQVYAIFGVVKKGETVSWEDFLRYIHPEDQGLLEAAINSIVETDAAGSVEYRILPPEGGERLVYQYAARKVDGDDSCLMLSGTIQDITERKELSTRLEKLSEHIPGFIFQCHKNPAGRYKFSYVGKGIQETCGISPDRVVENSADMLELIHEDDVEDVMLSMEESAVKLTTWYANYRIRHPEKGVVWLEGHATPGKMLDGSVLWYGYIWDVTERKESEDRIHKLALYDPLTGLANRRLMRDRLGRALSVSERNASWCSLIMLDLDNFKTLNDTKGHELGDALLIDVAARLKGCTRESDTISRLGGDEFVVILEDIGATVENARKNAMELAEKIRHSLSVPYTLDKGKVVHHGSGSVGVTVFQGKTANESTLLKRADVAMYEAKEKGRNQVCLYSEERQREINRKSALMSELQRAVQNNELSLYFQPQIDAHGRLCGAEALLRWFPADRDPVPPATFIPLAEQCGLILPIGEWVMFEACSRLRVLRQRHGVLDEFFLGVCRFQKSYKHEISTQIDSIRFFYGYYRIIS